MKAIFVLCGKEEGAEERETDVRKEGKGKGVRVRRIRVRKEGSQGRTVVE